MFWILKIKKNLNIFAELHVFNCHNKIKSVVDIYLKDKKYKNEEEFKILKAM